jgi:hypothetical protein
MQGKCPLAGTMTQSIYNLSQFSLHIIKFILLIADWKNTGGQLWNKKKRPLRRFNPKF